jgi:hypothetical protein
MGAETGMLPTVTILWYSGWLSCMTIIEIHSHSQDHEHSERGTRRVHVVMSGEVLFFRPISGDTEARGPL